MSNQIDAALNREKQCKKILARGIATCRLAMFLSGGEQVVITLDKSVMYWEVKHEVPND